MELPASVGRWPFSIVDSEDDFAVVDVFRSRVSASYACRMLNGGHGIIDCHGVLGCRVQPVPNPAMGVETEWRLGSGWKIGGTLPPRDPCRHPHPVDGPVSPGHLAA